MRLSWPAALTAAAPKSSPQPPRRHADEEDYEDDDATTGRTAPSPATAAAEDSDSDVDESELRRELLNDKWRQLFDKYDPEGFGEIPWEEFLEALQQPDFLAEVDENKRDILAERAREHRTTAITFQDFVNVMSGKRSRSFKCAVHQRDREVSSENDFHVLARDPPAFRRMVRLIADEFLTEERDRKYYADHYSCCPPPLFVVFVTLLEVVGFLRILHRGDGRDEPLGPRPHGQRLHLPAGQAAGVMALHLLHGATRRVAAFAIQPSGAAVGGPTAGNGARFTSHRHRLYGRGISRLAWHIGVRHGRVPRGCFRGRLCASGSPPRQCPAQLQQYGVRHRATHRHFRCCERRCGLRSVRPLRRRRHAAVTACVVRGASYGCPGRSYHRPARAEELRAKAARAAYVVGGAWRIRCLHPLRRPLQRVQPGIRMIAGRESEPLPKRWFLPRTQTQVKGRR